MSKGRRKRKEVAKMARKNSIDRKEKEKKKKFQ